VTGDKKSTLKRQSLSEVNMSRCSAICKKLRLKHCGAVSEKRWSDFESSTEHNILQRFRRHLCDLQALRQLCIKNRPDSVLEIAAWAQEHFQEY